MNALIDITGQKFNRWTAIRHAGGPKWLFRCECGKELVRFTGSVTRGKTLSCGCARPPAHKPITHNMSRTRLYKIWINMRRRCLVGTDRGTERYKARGISVCPTWVESFEPFAEWSLSNGYADNLTIDRIDNTGNYTPENCRWTDWTTQACNKSNTVRLPDGRSLRAVCIEHGVTKRTLRCRLKRGWDALKAATTAESVGY